MVKGVPIEIEILNIESINDVVKFIGVASKSLSNKCGWNSIETKKQN